MNGTDERSKEKKEDAPVVVPVYGPNASETDLSKDENA